MYVAHMVSNFAIFDEILTGIIIDITNAMVLFLFAGYLAAMYISHNGTIFAYISYIHT